MTNEEMKALYASLNSIEDAYNLMKENGYSGTMEDFEALCTKAADEIGPMELDDMEDVAGGISWEGIKEGAIDAWDATTGALSKGWNWVTENPALTAEIAGGTVVAAIGVTLGVSYINYRREKAAREAQWRPKNYYPPQEANPSPIADNIRRLNTI